MTATIRERVPLGLADTVELLFSARGAKQWLRADTQAGRVHPGCPIALPDGRAGAITAVAGASLTVDLVGDNGVHETVMFTFENAGERRTRIHAESDAPDVGRAVAEAARVGWDVADRRSPRQAVILIHGIGEQTPGATIRQFVEGLIGKGRYLSKPEIYSDTTELRRLQAWRDEDEGLPRTDFFEYYWAHKLRETPKAQVVSWLWRIVKRPRKETPKQLHTIWLFTRVLAVTVVVLAAMLAARFGIADLTGAWKRMSGLWFVAAGFGILNGAITGFLTTSLGDAARYLTARPANVEVRRAIREGGVELLRNLEASGRYHRIVVAGHSLGSVIAYDVLTRYWGEVNTSYRRPPARAQRALERYEEGDHTPEAQHAVWQEMRRDGHPWLVTDLVTLGSPLAHGLLLMASDRDDFDRRTRSREYPTCPPLADVGRTGTPSPRPYSFPLGPRRRALHHAALFVPTRWTNLYFPARFGVFGDPVGGPLGELFGTGIRDVAVTRGRSGRTPKSHSLYWVPPAKGRDSNHLDELDRALDLGQEKELASLASDLPTTDFLADS